MSNKKKNNWSDEELCHELKKFKAFAQDSMLQLEYARAVSKWCGASEEQVLRVVSSLLDRKELCLTEDYKIPVKRFDLDDVIHKMNFSNNQYQGWELFRHLIDYYIGCINAEAVASFSFFSDQYQKTFSFLNGYLEDLARSHWYPRQHSNWEIALEDGSEECFTELSPVTDNLYLGYPLFVRHLSKDDDKKYSEDQLLLKPVFVWHLKCTSSSFPVGGYRLSLISEDTEPEVNLDWLKYAFKKTEQRTAFLEECGLFDDGRFDNFDPESEDSTTCCSLNQWSVPALAKVIQHYFSSRCVETLDPSLLQGGVLDTTSKTGFYNRAIVFTSTPTVYRKSLISELKSIKKLPDEVLDKTALKTLFYVGKSELSKQQDDEDYVIDISKVRFNPAQRNAVSSILNSDLTVMQGPPGTGKSQVVAGVTLNERIKHKTVLISAFNHKAIDAVAERLKKIKLDDCDVNFLVRCNNREQGDDVSFVDMAKHQLDVPIDGLASDRLKICEDNLSNLAKLRADLEEKVRSIFELLDSLHDYGDAKEKIEKHAEYVTDDIQQFDTHKISKLNASLQKISFDDNGGLPLFYGLLHPVIFKKLKDVSKKLKSLNAIGNLHWFKAEQTEIIKSIVARIEEIEHYSVILNNVNEVKTKLQALPESYDSYVSKIASLSDDIANLLPQIISLDEKNRHRHAMNGHGSNVRQSLENMIDLMRKYFSKADTSFKHFITEQANEMISPLLAEYPAWAVSSLSISRFIPPIPALFDLVLIDEATQADIPSAIPLLYRAKRAAIIGDPMQLQFISSLRPDTDRGLRTQNKINDISYTRYSYLEKSFYDFARSCNSANPVALDETFRSCSAIAAYSSHNFYNGMLQVGTDEEHLLYPKKRKPGIDWIDTSGEIASSPGGGCYCEAESDAVAHEVKSIVVAGFKGTLGVVTPFRVQAQHIEDRVSKDKDFTEQLKRLNFNSATAHSFQGDERDVIILSLCSGPNMPQGSHHFVASDPNIFNVAVSRARSLVLIVGNKSWAQSCGIKHIMALTKDYSSYYQPKQTKWAPYESPLEKKLGDALEKKGFKFMVQHKVGCRRLDLAMIEGDAKLDIEVDGEAYHRDEHGHRKKTDLYRDVELCQRGWKTLRIWSYEINDDLDKAVKLVADTWAKLVSKTR